MLHYIYRGNSGSNVGWEMCCSVGSHQQILHCVLESGLFSLLWSLFLLLLKQWGHFFCFLLLGLRSKDEYGKILSAFISCCCFIFFPALVCSCSSWSVLGVQYIIILFRLQQTQRGEQILKYDRTMWLAGGLCCDLIGCWKPGVSWGRFSACT